MSSGTQSSGVTVLGIVMIGFGFMGLGAWPLTVSTREIGSQTRGGRIGGVFGLILPVVVTYAMTRPSVKAELGVAAPPASTS